MASIEKRKDGSYRVIVSCGYDVNGTITTLTTLTEVYINEIKYWTSFILLNTLF